MKNFNNLFYIFLFLGLFLPTNSNYYIPIFGVLIKINELLFLFLPFVNLLCTSKNQFKFRDKKLKQSIILFLITVLFTEVVVKYFYYSQSFGESIKAIRIGIPLFSSLLIFSQGMRADIKIVWKVLLLAICSSVILSLLSLVFNIPIYFNLEVGKNILDEGKGRLMNSNTSFGLIGLYLLFKDKKKWYNQGKLVKITAILSIIALLLSFNRTFLLLIALELTYIMLSSFSIIQVMKTVFFGSFFLGSVVYSYYNSQIIKNQVNKRILFIVYKDQTISESIMEGNREVIYGEVLKKIKEDHWIIGLPFRVPIFTWSKRWATDEERNMSVTDTSFATILLRYGILPLILISIILKRMYFLSSNRTYKIIFLLLLIASLNVDTITRQNSILFLIMVFLITEKRFNEKNSIYSKD